MAITSPLSSGGIFASGPAGKDGRDGKDGLPGRDGLNGKDGLPGADGPIGKTGLTGAKGETGAGTIIKGGVANYAALPTTGMSMGDVYLMQSAGTDPQGQAYQAGDGYVYKGGAPLWQYIGPIRGPKGEPTIVNGKTGDSITLTATDIAAAPTSTEKAAGSSLGAPRSLALEDLRDVARRKQVAAGTFAAVLRSELERDTDDAISVFEYIAKTKQAAIMAGTWNGDLSDEINAALATGRNVYLPSGGTYPIAKQLLLSSVGQMFFGNGDRINTKLRVLASFNMSASAVLTLQGHCAVFGFTFDCDQPSGDTSQPSGGITLSQINQYPWLIDVSNAERCRIDRIRMSKGWNGINAQGNAAQGLAIGLVEDGCLNQGLVIGTSSGVGPADFLPIGVWHCWVFGSVGTGLQLWSEANPGSIYFGMCDGLAGGTVTLYMRNIILNGVPRTGISVPLAASFACIKMDSQSQLIALGGSTNIASFDTVNSGNVRVLDVTGGSVTIGAARIARGSPVGAPLVRVSGGYLAINGGEIYNPGSAHDFEVNCGVLQLTNARFVGGGSQIKSNGFVYQGGGRVSVMGCYAEDATGSAAGKGYFVCLTTNDWNTVGFNYAGNRRLRQPASPISVCLGPNNAVAGIDTF